MSTPKFWIRDDGAAAAFGSQHEMTLWAIDVVRRYAPDPITDEAEYERRQFQRECERDRAQAADAEQFFLEQQSPADHNFR